MDLTSNFDPALFLDSTFTAPLIRRPPLAPQEYQSTISKVTIRPWKKKDDPTVGGLALDVVHEITVPVDQQQRIGAEKVMLTHGGFIDLTPDGKGLDNSPGKNRTSRYYREATDLNKPGDTFSYRMLIGKMVKVRVINEMFENEPVDKIDSVAKL